MVDLTGGVIAEMKRNPYTSLSALLCLCLTFAGGPFLYTNKADASDLQALDRKITALDITVKRESAQGELNNVRRELFDLTLRINTLERENINVDPLLYNRREALQAQQRDLEAKLRDMLVTR
jgi:hypothetical protein